MKLLLAGLIAASTVTVAVPAMAQSVYIGPNGFGVGVGARPYGGYDRGSERRGPAYEGRSAYRGDREVRRDGDFRRNRDFRRDRDIRGDRF